MEQSSNVSYKFINNRELNDDPNYRNIVIVMQRTLLIQRQTKQHLYQYCEEFEDTKWVIRIHINRMLILGCIIFKVYFCILLFAGGNQDLLGGRS